MESKKGANTNTMKISMEELALQRIFDLKKEFGVELESHHTKLKEGLLWNLFIKGIDPPPWLRPIFPPSSNYGSGYRDSFNSSIRDDRFSGFGAFGRKRPRFNSNVPDCFLEETELEGFENGHMVGTGSKQVLDGEQNNGNGGKHSLVAAQAGKNAEKQHSLDAQVDQNGIKDHLADVQVDQNGIKENLPAAQVDQNEIKEYLADVQIGRNIENQDMPALAQMDMDICEENKGPEDGVNGSGRGKTRRRPRARGLAKERNKTGNVVQSPFVGRMTRSRAKQCQTLLRGNELGKRKAIASKQTSNKRVRHDIEVEEPNNVTLRSSTKVGSGTRDSFWFATSTLEPQGIIPSAMTQSHCENHKTEGNSPAVRTLMQGANNSEASVMAMLEAEDNAIIDNVDGEKETLKKSGVKSRDLEQVYEQAEESGRLPVRCSIESHDLDAIHQPEMSEATDTGLHQDISIAQRETIKEKQPSEFRSELTSRVIEECVETVQHSDALEAVGSPQQYRISEIIDRQVDSALAYSFLDLQKYDSNIILDPTKKFRSRSLCLESYKNIPRKDNNSDSKLLASRKQVHEVVVGGGDYTNQIHFSRSQKLSKKSEILTVRGERDQNHFSSEKGHPSASICCSLSFEKKLGKQSGRTGFETNPCKVFNASASAAKLLKPQHRSWSGDLKLNTLAQEPRILQSKSRSGVFEYIKPALDSNANDASLVSQFEWAVTPYTFNSKINKENEGQKNVGMMKKIPSEVEVDIVPQNSEVIGFVAEKMNAPSEENMFSQMEEATEFVAGEKDEPSVHLLKTGDIPRKVQDCNSNLRVFCQNKVSKGQMDTIFDSPVCASGFHDLLDMNIDFMNVVASKNRKLFSDNVVRSKEEGSKPQHRSWPVDRKQNALTQEPRLLQSKSCSGVFKFNNPAPDSNANEASLISQFERAVTPLISNSKFNKENEGHSYVDMMKKTPSEAEDDSVPQKSEIIEFVSEEMDEPSEHLLKSDNMRGRIPACDSTLRGFCKDRSYGEQKDRKQNALAQEPRLLQSKSWSGVFKYSNHALDSNANDAGLVSQLESAVTPHNSNSKIDKESEGQRNVYMLKKIPSEVEDDIVPQKSEVVEFVYEEMDEPSQHLLQSDNMIGRVPACDSTLRGFCSDGSYGEQKDIGHESHGVLTGMSISEVAPKKKRDCLEVDCQLEVTIANSELAEGVRGIPGMQHLIKSAYMFSPTRQTVDASGNLKGLEGLNHGFSSNDRHFILEKLNAKAEKSLEYEAIRDGRASSVNGTKAFSSLTPVPNYVSKCRIHTPSEVRWPVLAMEPQEYSEKSSEFWEKTYGPNGFSADKIWTNSGSKDVGYGLKIKYSGSLALTSGMLFDKTGSNSLDTSSNLIMIQDEMNREHVGCFPIEEESGFEEESMDLYATVNESAKSPLMNKSALGAKSVLLDCSSAKQNSPLMTPAGGRLFQKSSINSTDIGSNLFSKQVSKSQKNLSSFNLEEELVYGKENKVPCEQGTELQKKYGSSVKRKVIKNHNLRTNGSFASQISPRSHQKPSNILSNVKSFIPLVQQKKAAAAAASVMTGKRDIKVKALEVAEAAKRQEEKKEQERKMRKELARRGGNETNLHEKSKEERCKGEKEGDETSRGTSECSNISISSGLPRKRLVGCASQKSHAENSYQPDTTACGVVLKVKRVLEAKTKLEQERLRKLEEEQRRKEEERKKKEAEIAAKKRKREEIERKEREEKRKRYEVAQRQQKELEEQLRTEKEVKEQRRRALDEYERKRKAMEEETKKQRRLEKEKEAAERRRQLEEDAKASKFTYKDAKHVDETNLQVQKAYAGKVSSMSNNCGNTGQLDIEGQSRHVQISVESYEISPYKGSDDDDDDSAPKKFIPLWARKENLIPHLISQQHIDPDEIFTGGKTCSLYEVFGTDGSLRRRDFSRRSHSGEWLNDKFTWKEEYQYKLQMGYLNKG